MKLIVIGAGPGGYETALLAAQRGAEVVLIESGRVGGTCLNEGCIPTKAFCRSAEMLEELRRAGEFGVTGLDCGFDFGVAAARKDAVVDRLREGVEALLKRPGLTLVHGRASFVDSHTVRVAPAEPAFGAPGGAASGEAASAPGAEAGVACGAGAAPAGENVFTADAVIIATGSRPSWPDIPGAHLGGVVSSAELLAVDHVPERLCVIGGGVIGLEFASIFRSFGSEVTVVEYCREILPRFDKDISKRLRKSLASRGIEFYTGSRVLGISSVEGMGQDSAAEVTFTVKDGEKKTVADMVLMAVGRRPAVDALNLDDVGVEYDARGIKTDGFMRTNVPGIYAVGDITGGFMLAHAATMQGVKALDHIMGVDDGIDLSLMPAAVFTMPEAASVGMTEEDCAAAGIRCTARKTFFRANGKALCLGETEGMCKVITDADGRIVGCHIFGPHASDLIHEAAAFMSRGASLEDMDAMIHVHPSLSEIFRG